MKIEIPSPRHKITKFPDKLSTDSRLTKKEIATIMDAAYKLDFLFKDFNKTVCANCPVDVAKFLCGEIGAPKLTAAQKRRGCCFECADCNGYFMTALVDDAEEQLEEIKKKYGWTERYGFFDIRKKQCKLSYWRRSVVCSSVCCVKAIGEIADQISEPIRRIKCKHQIIH